VQQITAKRQGQTGTPPLTRQLKQYPSLGVLNLSATATSLVMWGSYAQNHSGLVLSFNQAHPFFHKHQSQPLPPLRPVIYGSPNDALPGDYALVFNKPEEWAHEEEWRLVRPLDEADKVHEQGSAPLHLFKFPASALEAIIFGCRMSPESQAKLAGLLQNDMRYKRIKLQRCLLDPATRGLVIEPLVSTR